MRRPPARPERDSTIALINIVFLMLIFFLVAGTLAQPLDPGLTLVRSADLEGNAPPQAPPLPPVTAAQQPVTAARVAMAISAAQRPEDAVLPVQPEAAAPAPSPVAELPVLQALTPLEKAPEPKPERQAEPKPKPDPKPRKAPAQTAPKDPVAKPARKVSDPRADARSAVAGQATGQAEGRKVTAGSGGATAEAGNAALSNYPGQVMRKLSRAPRPRVGVRGAATVAFTVAANGRIETIGLAASSGSAKLDEAALRLVRRAGPFPKPPAGAMRRFTVQIEGR